MKWRCKTCGCDTFKQTLEDITEYNGCSFSEIGHIKTWYSTKREDFNVKVQCEQCNSKGLKISDIADWGDGDVEV